MERSVKAHYFRVVTHIAAGVGLGVGTANAALQNDYPTEVIADYVYGCMKANGETPESLLSCSCSVDVVASIIPYERYEEAQTFLSMMQTKGEVSALFRDTAESKAAIQDLRRAQAEGEIRCFKGS
jgi:hypothetical protein